MVAVGDGHVRAARRAHRQLRRDRARHHPAGPVRLPGAGAAARRGRRHAGAAALGEGRRVRPGRRARPRRRRLPREAVLVRRARRAAQGDAAPPRRGAGPHGAAGAARRARRRPGGAGGELGRGGRWSCRPGSSRCCTRSRQPPGHRRLQGRAAAAGVGRRAGRHPQRRRGLRRLRAAQARRRRRGPRRCAPCGGTATWSARRDRGVPARDGPLRPACGSRRVHARWAVAGGAQDAHPSCGRGGGRQSGPGDGDRALAPLVGGAVPAGADGGRRRAGGGGRAAWCSAGSPSACWRRRSSARPTRSCARHAEVAAAQLADRRDAGFGRGPEPAGRRHGGPAGRRRPGPPAERGAGAGAGGRRGDRRGRAGRSRGAGSPSRPCSPTAARGW